MNTLKFGRRSFLALTAGGIARAQSSMSAVLLILGNGKQSYSTSA